MKYTLNNVRQMCKLKNIQLSRLNKTCFDLNFELLLTGSGFHIEVNHYDKQSLYNMIVAIINTL